MKQTAVDWLIDEIYEQGILDGAEQYCHDTLKVLYEKAKEMEKDIIRNAFLDGQDEMREQCNWNTEHSLSSLEYYKKTFKK